MRIIKTLTVKIDPENIEEKVIEKAACVIKDGGLLIFPTETVYGLGANALDEEAVLKIFKAKGRPQDNPLIIHVAKAADAPLYCEADGRAKALMDRFWPGPLTLVLKKKPVIPDAVTCSLDSVAIRCPSNPIASALLSACALPVAAPSANLSGKPSPTSAAHVAADMEGRVDMIIDGGHCEVGLESTVLDLTEDVPRLLRPGGVTAEELREALGEIEVDEAVFRLLPTGDKPKSPGMKYRHYAPAAPVIIVDGPDDGVLSYINNEIRQNAAIKAGVLCYNEEKDAFPNAAAVVTLAGRGDLAGQARRLFGALRSFDDSDVSIIYARCPQKGGMGLALYNRLAKAAGFNIVTLP